MRYSLLLSLSLLACHAPLRAQPAEVPLLEQTEPDNALRGVLPGIDVLKLNNFDLLRGKRVGLVTNQTGITRDGVSTIDVLFNARSHRLVALFGPEHGIRGTATAGAKVSGGRDARTNLPIYSLYGATRRPNAQMMRGIDIMVFDMQDIGSRSYTYIATLGEVMQACARFQKPLLVLDRPNPIRGDRVEGSSAKSGFLSFVSPFPIPYCHGLTMGEVARVVNGRGYLKGRAKCNLRVVPMLGYNRTLTWPQTGLPWMRTSPNIPRQDSPYFYAATGIVGELSALSIGIGTNFPFQVTGAPGLNAYALQNELTRRNLPGLSFRAARWKPVRGAYRGQNCDGVQIIVTDTLRAQLTRVNFELMDAVRKIAPSRFASNKWFVGKGKSRMFDLVCGSDRTRRLFLSGANGSRIWSEWNSGAQNFKTARAPYLLYR